MISEQAKQILSQEQDPHEKEDPVILFSDYNGDSVVIRMFRYSSVPSPESAAAEWMRLAKQRCDSPSGELQTLMLAFPALGGWTENNVVAIVSGYDIVAKTEQDQTDP